MADRHYVRCIVMGNALAESKEKKTPSVKIRLQAIPGANPPIEGFADNRTLWADLWLTDAALESSIETLEKVLGWRGSSFAELNDPCFDGVEVDAACEWEDVNGQWREKVVFLNAPGGGGVKKMEDVQVRQVVSRLDAVLAKVRQNNPAAPAKPAPARRVFVGLNCGVFVVSVDGMVEPPQSRKNDLPDEAFFA
jgi:hypothetical protein